MSAPTRSNRPGFATRAIHAGQQPDPTTGAIMTPIYASSTYVQPSPGVHKGFDYSRTANPTRKAFEDCMADLESGAQGYAFASGMAGAATVLELLDSGDHVVAMDDLYGGSYRLFERVRKRSSGLDFSFVDLSQPDAFEAAITELPFVLDCHLVAGDFDYFLKIRVRDIADFNRLHGEQLIALPGVRQTRTFFVMKEVIDNAPLEF